MDRRKFLVGVGGAAVGGSALIGSGAFTRVESQRYVNIEVAEDPNAYLGMTPLDTLNSQNYVALDDDGHIYIQIDGEGDQQNIEGNNGPIGEGVNSNSATYFDGLLELCNNGKADAEMSYEFLDELAEEAEIIFYYQFEEGGERHDLEEGDTAWLGVGDCVLVGLRTETFGVNATEVDTLYDGTVQLVADAPGAGEVQETSDEPA